ncbi:Putative odorant receptor 13a [Atta colombica]|uniref:Putative odorant receptor 13a n=1 Tax=Atta colombica TaxID=520822 RepID=A0A195BPT9_9HYME|nr:Putative odorant receptor 13a [Atta colombica]
MMAAAITVMAVLPIFGYSVRHLSNITADLERPLPIQTYYIYDTTRNILLLLNMIKNDWLKPKMIKERDVMIKRARMARIFTIFGYFMMLGLGLSAVAIMYTGVDSFLSLLVFHVCGQLENLKIRIIHLDKFQNFENTLSQSVQNHIRLIRFINIIDEIFTLMLLGTLFYLGILFALNGFLLCSIISQGRDLSIPRLTFIITIFVNAFGHTCVYCAVGEILVAQCEGIYQAAYKYKWYNLEPKKAKNLMMIMIRANKSLYLTAGKLFPMTMSTFCNLLKTSGDYEWAIGLNRINLALLGVWPKNIETKRKKLISNIHTILMLNTVICGCYIPSIHSLFKVWDILPLLSMIKDDWLKPKMIKERDIMIKRARIARIFTMFGYFMMLSLGLSAAAIMYTGVDSFLSLLVFHVCGQLENLKIRIIHLDKFQNFENALSHSIQDHIRLIRFITIIDEIFTLMLLGTLFYFGILFAFYGFLLGTMITQGRDLSLPRLTFIITVFVNTFGHTCLYCAVGEILVAQCEGIYEAACKYKWYNLESKKAKSLMMIMIRANKSMYLTAGKLFPMTMSTFCNVSWLIEIVCHFYSYLYRFLI